MAVAGFHDVSMFDSSFLRESLSPQSRQWGEQNRRSTRASPLLQMWRELEGEHVVNHPNPRFGERIQRQRSKRSNTDSVSTFLSDGPESINGDESLEGNDVQNEYCTYSQSHVASENEQDDSNSVDSEQLADLVEVERERVRQIFREWMNSGAKSHSPNVSHVNIHSRAQWLDENERERVRIIMDWVQVSCQQRGNCDFPTDEGASEIGPQIELVRDGLLVNHGEVCEQKPIRRLCGRQALLELLTRAQRERKGELQELLDHKPVSNFTHRNRIQSDDASCNEDHNNCRNDQLQSNEEQEVLEVIYDLFEADEEREGTDFPAAGNIECDIIANANQQDSVIQAVEGQAQLIGQGDQEQELVSNVDYTDMGQVRQSDVSGNWCANATALVQETSDIDASAQDLLDTYEVIQEQDAPNSEASDAHEVASQVEDLEVNAAEDFNWQENPGQVEETQELALDHEEIEWQQLNSIEPNESTDGNEEGLAENWQENFANQWDRERPESEIGEHSHMLEPHEDWHDDGLQEAIDSWLDEPSGQEVGSIGMVDADNFPEDDNVYSMELRELLSRRRVSGLLQSGFRASLDQLIQSYVESQGNGSMDWEPDETPSSPALIDEDQEQQNGDPSGSVDRTSPSEIASQPPRDQYLHCVTWSPNSPHHRLCIEWEVINESRIDMVGLQQRMNNMQRMLEACMDMQLELQRSVRQEVSAALNRPAVPTDTCKDDTPKDDSKWDFVRKGICCMCCESNIDSLLYRCGHMCTCSGCAEKLVQGNEKCPMCRAPVLEVVRAYAIQ